MNLEQSSRPFLLPEEPKLSGKTSESQARLLPPLEIALPVGLLKNFLSRRQ